MHKSVVRIILKCEGEPSGLASMLSQYFEQNICDFPYKGEQARKIKGRLAIEAVEGGVAVTLSFKGDEIEIIDGRTTDVDASVRGGIFELTQLAAGGTSALGKIARHELETHSMWRHPLFALRVARFMSLPKEMKIREEGNARLLSWKLVVAVGAAAVILGVAVYLILE